MGDLTARIREILKDDPNVGEVRMFGGLCFMLNGNMLVCSTRGGELLVRVGEASMQDALTRPGASAMVMGGRAMRAYVEVQSGTLDDSALKGWIATATNFVGAMPAKSPGKRPARRKR